MSRPEISVVMPFAGDEYAARAAIEALLALDLRVGDELILADNSGLAVARGGVAVIRAAGERSPAHARNVGAAHAHGEWILFLDADCRAPSGLLDAYFAVPVADDVGALAGEVVALLEGDTLAARYGSARNFLSQQAHLSHPYRPRAVAANLLVRRAAFEQIGGFYEGVRAAEDTDFSWRLQQSGWKLELRRGAKVEHRYRATLSELRRQWRGYAAGRAWLARRYDGFEPEPAVVRAFGRLVARSHRADPSRMLPAPGARGAPPVNASRLERGRYLALDALLSAEELAGLVLSNRPAGRPGGAAEVVFVADRFPARGDPLGEYARALDGARVEAAARPEFPDPAVVGGLRIDYREDDGIAARAVSLAALVARHPLRAFSDVLSRRPGEPPLSALAPVVRRLAHDGRARVHALGGSETRVTARRIAHLAGRPLDDAPRRR
ncbi:MAG TPA: glycosyltransferase family 2 protein [Solirubrobacteraceae bacterium]|nr:glycosyltransferase family 2 protein [Solirubrobacteraceae bacterium]